VLTAKIQGYYRLAVTTGITTPVLIFTARPGREPGARAALTHTLLELPRPDLLPIVTGTARPIGATAAGPTAAPAGEPPPDVTTAVGRAWLPLTAHTRPDNTQLPRLTLAELAAAIPIQPRTGQPHPARGGRLLDPRRQPPIDPLDNRAHPALNGDPVLMLDGLPHDDLHDIDAVNDPAAAPDLTGFVDLPEPPPHPPQPVPAIAPRRW
jgi:hypothetical protein